MKQKEFVLPNDKVIDDIVKLKSKEGVAIRSGINFDEKSTFRIIGKNKRGKLILTDLSSQSLIQIETFKENLILIKRDEKKFKKVHTIINKTRLDRKLNQANNLWD